MTDLQGFIAEKLQSAVAAALGEKHRHADPMVRIAGDPKFGDFQANLAMALGKQLNRKPRDLADAIVANLEHGDWLAKAEVAGPGFINLTLTDAALASAASSLAHDDKLGVAPADPPLTVVVDYASPNLAKEMHIGHLRSTIIGDALARVLEAQGHRVVRQNHVGDWGTQFGMLLQHLLDTGWSASASRDIGDLNTLYQQAKKRDDSEPAFAEAARKRVVALQAGDPDARKLWSALIDASVAHMNDTFAKLGVTLTDADLRPESFYNDKLADVCESLEKQGVAAVSDGALCVFSQPAVENETPLIVRKSDGGYGYATTDLAALRYRAQDLGAGRVVYVVDARQQDHFKKFIAAARSAGWVAEHVPTEHVMFGTVLGPDRRPFKTREGGTVKLADVLDEAVSRAAAVVAERSDDLTPDERQHIAEVVGVGAVKYADLANDRIKDYVFDWSRMLALEGNTAPYLQYSYTRIAGILRKAERSPTDALQQPFAPHEPAERALALHLTQFGPTVAAVGATLEPHRLCNYLYELAARYHRFYEACPVLRADNDATKQARLALCALTGETLKRGLGLLGIGVVERM